MEKRVQRYQQLYKTFTPGETSSTNKDIKKQRQAASLWCFILTQLMNNVLRISFPPQCWSFRGKGELRIFKCEHGAALK